VSGEAGRHAASSHGGPASKTATINRDLPVALVETRKKLGVDLIALTRQHRDFKRIDANLASTEPT
jgi:Family of unknown function (DUF5995)